jgi:hypothetical protein
MELDPGPMENDNDSDSGDPENCGTGTVCYDLVPSYLVPSDHMISTFQQGHQAFPLVKLKDNFTNTLGGDAYHSLFPMPRTPTFIHTQPYLTVSIPCKHLIINMWTYHFYDEFPNEYSFIDEDLGLTTDKSNFDQYDFYCNLEELQEPPKTDNDTISNMQLPTSPKSGATSYKMLLPNVMKKCPPPT